MMKLTIIDNIVYSVGTIFETNGRRRANTNIGVLGAQEIENSV